MSQSTSYLTAMLGFGRIAGLILFTRTIVHGSGSRLSCDNGVMLMDLDKLSL